jgi:hypothetical protein
MDESARRQTAVTTRRSATVVAMNVALRAGGHDECCGKKERVTNA